MIPNDLGKDTHKEIDTVVADSKYGTIDNYLICHDHGIKAHIPSLEETHRGSGRQKGIFPKEAFAYRPDTDTFTCPAGHTLKRRHYYKNRNHYEYKASSELCARCELKEHCSRAKDGRTLKRHARQQELDSILTHARGREAKKDIKTCQHLSERSFGQSTRYGYKRARWRRLWRMQIQDFLIATTQNITVLITHSQEKISKSNAQIGHIIRQGRAAWYSFSFRLMLMRWLKYLSIAFAWNQRVF
jgi:hypothetical protein